MKAGKMIRTVFLLFLFLFLLSGCAGADQSTPEKTEESGLTESVAEKRDESAVPLEIEESDKKEEATDNKTEAAEETEEAEEDKIQPNGFCVVIDAGHQSQGNSELEPDGPGSSSMKAKVSGGTSGVSTKVPEYKLTLALAKKLEKELLSRGYEVIMTREKNKVDISNSERAEIANKAEADAFIRIHADGSSDPSASGIMTICQTSSNPYNGDKYKKSKALSEAVLECCVKETKAKDRGVWETDTMSGINWAKIPVTIIEVGFMTNPEEDERMQTDEYQQKLALGMADGIDRYLKVE